MIGISDAIEMSIINTSMAKIMPVIGAWKIEAKAAAHPMPISTTMFFWLSRSNCPILEPIAEPVETDGPSSPTEPPKPTVSELVMIDANVLYGLTAPLFFCMAYKIPGIPCPTSRLRKYRQKMMVSRIPIAGSMKNNKP